MTSARDHQQHAAATRGRIAHVVVLVLGVITP